MVLVVCLPVRVGLYIYLPCHVMENALLRYITMYTYQLHIEDQGTGNTPNPS
jgi:hypothetical protein